MIGLPVQELLVEQCFVWDLVEIEDMELIDWLFVFHKRIFNITGSFNFPGTGMETILQVPPV